MTADNAPVLIVILAMFATFMTVVGTVHIWSNLPAKTARRRPAQAPANVQAQPAR
jgi:hypothetical protein